MHTYANRPDDGAAGVGGGHGDGQAPRQPWSRLTHIRASVPGPVLFLVEGAAGSGKSRLVRRALEVDVFAGLPRTVAVCTAEGVRTTSSDAPKPPHASEPPKAFPDAFVEDLASVLAPVLAAAEPCVLLVENMHLADAETRRMLWRCLRRAGAGTGPEAGAEAAAFTLILTYRPEELPVPGLPWGWAVDYPAELTVVRQRVGALTAAQVTGMAHTALGGELCGPGFAARLYQRAGGNAQVAVDLLRLCAPVAGDTRRRTSEDVDEAGVPARLSELTLGRLAGLPERYRPVVWAAAVLDEPVGGRELAVVAGLDGPDGPDGPGGPGEREPLIAALAAGVLQECGAAGEAGYGFAVPLAAKAVRESLPGPTRERLHRAAADFLVRAHPVPWERVAHHRRGGRQVRQWLRAVERAARQYEARGDHLAAIRLLERTLAVSAVPREFRDRLAIVLAHNALEGPRSDRALEVLRQIVDDPDLAPGVRGEARLDLGMLLSNQAGDPLRGKAELVRAVEELAERPALASRAMSHLAMPDWPGLSLAENIKWLTRAEAAAERSGDEVAKAATLANRISVMLSTGDAGGWPLLERLPRESEILACRQHAARGLVNAGEDAVITGYYRTARELLSEGIGLSERTGTPYSVASGRGARLLCDWMTGDWRGLPERARALADETERMSMITGLPTLSHAALALARGEWTEVKSLLYGPAAPRESSAPHTLLALASGLRIRLALAREQSEEATREAARTWRRLREKGVWVWAAEVAPWALQAVLGAGRAEEAEAMVAEYAAGIRDRDAPVAAAALDWCRAALAEARGERAEALAHFHSARGAYAELPRPYMAALAAERAGHVALAVDEEGRKSHPDEPGRKPDHDEPGRKLDQDEPGRMPGQNDAGRKPDQDEAFGELRDAVSELSALGALWDAARVRATLRAHQPQEERRPRGRPSYGCMLSPREEEVARFAASGLTNKEIAVTLHLSPRTVEQHIARAMRKTGVQTRTGLTEPLPGSWTGSRPLSSYPAQGVPPQDDPGQGGPAYDSPAQDGPAYDDPGTRW
ncbi:helix-turn-helix transcriptional regulator [Streptomyces sp. NA04227]|uniref:helix-turn-helix transcriptional regulator n=1 Tax=Streptomyces sp. NA04227 TaxID=2742136 RepID=UPI0015903DF2|nr:LuxR family transcriptional regulator [Streptomyces sp. NA04227]QKW07608.1 helix-turn-helix transcriptional regulator [Streptomyces sp. NA04227]